MAATPNSGQDFSLQPEAPIGEWPRFLQATHGVAEYMQTLGRASGDLGAVAQDLDFILDNKSDMPEATVAQAAKELQAAITECPDASIAEIYKGLYGDVLAELLPPVNEPNQTT